MKYNPLSLVLFCDSNQFLPKLPCKSVQNLQMKYHQAVFLTKKFCQSKTFPEKPYVF